jgi:hypothetical protein
MSDNQPPRETPAEFNERHILLGLPVSWVQLLLYSLDKQPPLFPQQTEYASKIARIKRVLRTKLQDLRVNSDAQ